MIPPPAALQFKSQEKSFGAGAGSAANPFISKMRPNSSEAGGFEKSGRLPAFEIGKIGSQLLGGVAGSRGKSGAVTGRRLGERRRSECDQQEQSSD